MDKLAGAAVPVLSTGAGGPTTNNKNFSIFLGVAAGFGLLAFLFPWFYVNSSVLSWSYVPAQNLFTAYVGVSDYVGGGWFLFLLTVAVMALLTRRPSICVAGLIAMVPTLIVLILLTVACYLVPSLIPEGWIPARFHHDVPQIGGGAGAIFSVTSGILLMVWFGVLLIHSIRLRRHEKSLMAHSAS